MVEMRLLVDVVNCVSWVYSPAPVCVKCEGSKSWADIEDRLHQQ